MILATFSLLLLLLLLLLLSEVTLGTFLGANLLPFRPSLPWCFPIRELPFEQKEQQVFPSGS